MSNLVKVILVVVVGGMLLCLLTVSAGFMLFRATGTVIANQINTDVVEAGQVGSEIFDYEIPEDFTEARSLQAVGCELVIYNGSDGHSHIYFFQLPGSVTFDLDQIEIEFQKVLPDNEHDRRNVKMVDSRPATIAGQEVTLIVSEGEDHDGEPYREVSAVLKGKGGQALVVFSRPVASWDEAEMEQFLASIR